MKKLTYETPEFERLEVMAEHGFAASTDNWFLNDMGGGSSQAEIPYTPDEETFG